MNYDEVLLDGLCADIAARTDAVWDPTGPYAATAMGIVVGDMPETPSQLIVVNPYLEGEVGTYRRDQETVVTFVQIRLRVLDAATGRELQTAIRDRYHRRKVVLVRDSDQLAVTGRQVSRGPLGPDANGRHLFTQNFTFTGLRERT